MTPALHRDPRWKALHSIKHTCATCGETHGGLFDLASNRPEHWADDGERSENTAVSESEHFWSEDFCVIEGRDYFVRCVLQLPIVGGEGETFGLGVWSTLSKPNFQRYVESFDDGQQAHLGPWFGWFSNRLKGYPDTLNLKCQVCPQNDRQRPLLELEPTDHPLAVEQRHGITLDHILELYRLNGHDLGL